MRTGNYQVKGGKVHRWDCGGHDIWRDIYVCGVDALTDDKRTTKPVTCKNCLRVMRGKK